jgi:hypothetical protein
VLQYITIRLLRYFISHLTHVFFTVYRTPIVLTGPTLTAAEWERVPEDLKAQYDPKCPEPEGMMEYALENPALVVDAIESAMTDLAPPM